MKRIFIYILIITGIVLIGSSLLLLKDKSKIETQNEKIEDDKENPFYEEETNQEDPIMVFKDISFIKNDSNSHIEFEVYKNKYILSNKKLYDLDGNTIIELSKYKEIKVVNDKYINADNDIYNFKGELIFKGNNYDEVIYEKSYFIVKQKDKYGVFDLDKKEVLEMQAGDINIESNNCISFSKKNNKGRNLFYIYNVKNKKTYGPYMDINYFNDEVIIVEKYNGNDIDDIDLYHTFNSNSLETYLLNISKNNETRKKNFDDYSFTTSEFINNKYIIASKFIDWKGYRYGVFDLNFNEVISFEYKDINIFDDKYILLSSDDNHKLLSLDLKDILTFNSAVSPIFIDIYTIGNIIEIEIEEDSYEYYDLKGTLVYKSDTNTIFSYIGNNKYIIDKYDINKCLYLELNNNKTKEIDYGFCESYISHGNNLVVKKTKNGKELYNNKLEKKSNNIYDYIHVGENLLIVEKDEKYTVLSYDEKLLIEKEFKDYDYIDNGEEYMLIDDQENMYYLSYK